MDNHKNQSIYVYGIDEFDNFLCGSNCVVVDILSFFSELVDTNVVIWNEWFGILKFLNFVNIY